MEKNKTKSIVNCILALLVYIVFMVGMGFFWNLFWDISKPVAYLYWISKGIIIVMVCLFALVLLFGKNGKGISAMQLFFSLALSVVPLIIRALALIPVAGIYIAGVFGFILICIYLLSMIGLNNY